MKLFKIELSGRFENMPPIYVEASDSTEAQSIVTKALNESDYGFSSNRHVIKIDLLAEEDLYGPTGVLFRKDEPINGLAPRKPS